MFFSFSIDLNDPDISCPSEISPNVPVSRVQKTRCISSVDYILYLKSPLFLQFLTHHCICILYNLWLFLFSLILNWKS
jgi:hypothetical protein